MKTVLAPSAPWPDPNAKRVVEQKPKKFVWRSENIDYFADTHNELLQPPKRGRGNPNAAKNFAKFNLRFL
jgi:hypothetical protein